MEINKIEIEINSVEDDLFVLTPRVEDDLFVLTLRGDCYCCFNKTEHRSPCDCKAYICKKCFKKYKKYETECKICKTELIIEETDRDKFIRGFKESFKEAIFKCDDYLSICLIKLLFHPICMIIVCISLVSSIILIPSFIYCMFAAIINNIEYKYILNPRTWFGGIFVIIMIMIIFGIMICLISTLIKFIEYMFY